MNQQAELSRSSQLAYFPVSFFAMIMGMSGLTLAWGKAAQVLGAPSIINQLLLILTLVLFTALCGSYLMKLFTQPEAVRAELNHPIKLSFFPTFSISLLLLSAALLPLSKPLSLALWSVGAVLHLLFTLYVLTQWIHHPKFQIAHSTPAWFIPIVGNIIVPIAGVEHGFMEISWFFFSIGLLFWIILKALILNRVIFHDPLPEKLLPTLFIFIAPPAVGFTAYLKLTGTIDTLAQVLFNVAMFLVLLLLTQFARFSKIRFYVSWWAYSFPLAAASIAAQVMYSATSKPLYGYLSFALLSLASLVILVLLMKTFAAVWRNEICQPEG
ncbi:SLAC1 anion channel family protein [Ferrimonas sp. SCSIO 43195]|uniref:SLAC1 anion channel family protein n=1 Tax=Ferrimonas sp. SCSIO 43195 TaxID=2822844 RepID=UPI0020752B61|nr:SLAC1 anion channel family protein [Ferrimonas sp. SCSIO 43195]USD37532.1 SLAC1 anion channel family protein [Ferrimonas sp. SCSIO 43195]